MSALRLAPASDCWDFPRSTTGLRVLLDVAEASGMPAQRALVGTGLSPADVTRLESAGAEVTAAQELQVVRTLHRAFGEVGAAVGEQYDAATFGAFGFALLASRTVLDAMGFAVRFIDLSHAFALPHASIDGAEVVVSIDGAGLPADVRRFLVERDAVAVHRVLESLVPGGVGATLVWAEARDSVAIRFAADQLERPLPERSAQRLALSAQVCAGIVDARRSRTGLAQEVRVLITQGLARGAPMGEVAAALAVSERTLRRRLSDQGTGYQELLDEVRSALAATLLDGHATMPVAAVAARLGYADAAAFAHARARWRRRVPTGQGTVD